MNARSALFDVYGDHLLPRGGVAAIASLVELLAALDIAAPAVRTAVSRMVSQGWLEPARLSAGPAYRLTPRAERRLADAAVRIYRRDTPAWDRHWHLVSLDQIGERTRRERVRSGLRYLGYAPMRDGTWLSPRPSAEVAALLEAEGVGAHEFTSSYDGKDAELAAECWDLDALATSYTRWLGEARQIAATVAEQPTDQEAFVARSRLVHEWRKFLFSDPGLPRELLPHAWPGDEAAAFFDAEADRLVDAAGRYVESCLRL